MRSRIPALRGRTGGRAGGAAPALAELDLTNMIVGYNSRDAAADANGDFLSCPDLGPNGDTINAVGALTARADLATDAGYGGVQVVVPTAINGHQARIAAYTGGSLSQPFTVFYLGEQAGGSTDYHWGSGVALTGYCYYANASDLLTCGSGAPELVATTATTDDVPFAAAVVYAGASSKIYFNDFVTADKSGTIGASAMAGLTIGGNSGAGSGLDGKWCACYVYSGAADAALLANVGAYWNQEFGQSVTV